MSRAIRAARLQQRARLRMTRVGAVSPRTPRCAASTARASPDDARRRDIPAHSALRRFNAASLHDGRRRDIPAQSALRGFNAASPDDGRRRDVATQSALRGFNAARLWSEPRTAPPIRAAPVQRRGRWSLQTPRLWSSRFAVRPRSALRGSACRRSCMCQVPPWRGSARFPEVPITVLRLRPGPPHSHARGGKGHNAPGARVTSRNDVGSDEFSGPALTRLLHPLAISCLECTGELTWFSDAIVV